MSNPLEPMRVEMADILSWMRETRLLFFRKPLSFLVVSLLFFYVCHLMQIRGFVSFFVALLLCLFSIVVCIVIARGADESRSLSVNIWYQSLLNSFLTLFLFAAFFVLLWVVAAKVADMLMLDEVIPEETAPPPIQVLQWLYPGTVSLFVVYIGIMVTTMWFLLPLSAFHKLSLTDAVKFAKSGERMNFAVIAAASYLPFMAFFILFVFSELALVVAIIGLPMFSIYQYVSFRHVYMNRKESEPRRVKAVDAVPAET